MAEVTINDQHEHMGGAERAYDVTIAATGDTLSTPFTRIVSIQCTQISTASASTYMNATKSGGVVTFHGAGTGFAGDWSVKVTGYL